MSVSNKVLRDSEKGGGAEDLAWLASLSYRLGAIDARDAGGLALDALVERFEASAACILERGPDGWRASHSRGVDHSGANLGDEGLFNDAIAGEVVNASPDHPTMRRFGLASGLITGIDATSSLGVFWAEKRAFEEDEASLLIATASALALRLAGDWQAASVTNATLEERVKELSCVYSISRAFAELPPFAPTKLWEETLWKVVRLVPSGMRYSSNVGVRLTLHERTYASNFFPTGEILHAPIASGGTQVGEIEVCYIEPPHREGPLFLAEEEDLIRELGDRIGIAAETRRISAALAESEARFRQLAEYSRDVFWIRSAQDGRLQYVSPAFDTIWPASNAADLSIRWLAGVHPDDRPAYAQALDTLLDNGTMDLEYRVVDATGTEHWIHDRAWTFSDDSGQAGWIGGMATDTTDIRRASEAVENERLLALLHASPVGMLIADAAGRILLINQEAERILNRKQIPGARLDEHGLAPEMLYPDGTSIPNEKRPLNRALYNGETIRAEEVHYQHPSGTLVTLTNTTPFYHPDGRIAGAIAVIQDVTHFEELDRLRGEFLAMISHELRTPLTIIKGSTALGTNASPDPTSEIRHYFNLINSQVDHLKALVDNLLDMTSIEAGHLTVNRRSADLGSLLAGSISSVRQSYPDRTIELQINDGLPQVMADEGRILQVIQNLLVNACKFSSPGGRVQVRAERYEDQVRVSVADDGEGIEPADLTRIFNKFQRRSSQGATIEGIGLGLAICKSLVEAHGGRIWAESAGPGQGATFHFTLPVSSEVRGASPSIDVSGLTVIALDDEPQILKYLQRSLGAVGYVVHPAYDSDEAIRLVQQGAGELLLLDLFLGADHGRDVLQRVREFSDIPIIILTGSNDDDDAVLALHLGADDYVRKPFSSGELDARIQAVLRRRAARPSIQKPLQIGDVLVDLAAHEVLVSGQRVQLSSTEYKLLVELMLNAGRVLTHEQLLKTVWGPEYSTEVALIRPYIKSLRKKIGDSARDPSYIFTEREVGYWFRK